MLCRNRSWIETINGVSRCCAGFSLGSCSTTAWEQYVIVWWSNWFSSTWHCKLVVFEVLTVYLILDSTAALHTIVQENEWLAVSCLKLMLLNFQFSVFVLQWNNNSYCWTYHEFRISIGLFTAVVNFHINILQTLILQCVWCKRTQWKLKHTINDLRPTLCVARLMPPVR